MPRRNRGDTFSEILDSAVDVVFSVTRQNDSSGGTAQRSPQTPISKNPRRKTSTLQRSAPAQKSKLVSPLWDLHVKHHPVRMFYSKSDLVKLPSLYRDGEVDQWGRIPLDCVHLRYIFRKDPLIVLEAFNMAHEEKLYPPLWVLDFLHIAFKKYLTGNGVMPLDYYLGIGGKPKEGSRFKQRSKQSRDGLIAVYICWYADLRKCSIETAAEHVALHWNAGLKKDLYKFGYGLDKPLRAETLAQNYVRRWRKQFRCDEKYLDVQTRLRSLTEDQRQQFLAKFD